MAEQQDIIDPLFKLKNSPLQGVEAYRSPFYRRLLSAGYKGYIQGSLGGATLFAALGSLAGVVVAIGGAMILPAGAAATAFLAVPIMAVGGLIYGKDSFGQIGAMAAISAEQAEMNEKRRSLLDRYYETPSKEEAKAIEEMLKDQSEEKMPRKWFHWKAALLGAVVVGAAAALVVAVPSLVSLYLPQALPAITQMGEKVIGSAMMQFVSGSGFASAMGAAGIGGLVGSLVGIDRAYIRKWFDVQERFHDDAQVNTRKIEHQQNVERLQQAYRAEGYGSASRGGVEAGVAAQPISPRTVAPTGPTGGNLDERPQTKVQAKDAEIQNLVNMKAPVAAL